MKRKLSKYDSFIKNLLLCATKDVLLALVILAVVVLVVKVVGPGLAN